MTHGNSLMNKLSVRGAIVFALAGILVTMGFFGVSQYANAASSSPASVKGGVGTQHAIEHPGIRGKGFIWTNQAAFGNAYLTKLDYQGNIIIQFVPDGGITGNGRGVAVDSRDGNLWYTDTQTFNGDGVIHKVSQSGGSDLMTIPDPGGVGGSGIGAIDFFEGHLWAVSYLADGNGEHTVYKLNPNNGKVLASCTIEDDGSEGDDSLAVIGHTRDGSARFLTDSGEFFNPVLTSYFLPTTNNAGECVADNTYNLPFGATGIDTRGPNLYASDLSSVFKIGHSPYNGLHGSILTTGNTEDISVMSPQDD